MGYPWVIQKSLVCSLSQVLTGLAQKGAGGVFTTEVAFSGSEIQSENKDQAEATVCRWNHARNLRNLWFFARGPFDQIWAKLK